MNAGRIAVPLAGRTVEVPVAALTAELARRGPIASLALLEALVRCAAPEGRRPTATHPIDRAAAIARMLDGLDGAAPGTITLLTLLGLVRLDAAGAAPRLTEIAARLDPPLSTVARVAAWSVAGHFVALARAIADDDQLAQRAPLVLAATVGPPEALAPAFAALLEALERLQPTLGVTAYRAFLGDLAEAVFRALQRSGPGERPITTLLGEGREGLVDRLCAELPGTPDLVAARGMAWLLGTVAPSDDAARSAIERARGRFRDPAFHRDCAAMLGELPARGPGNGNDWPPPPERPATPPGDGV